MLNRRSCLVSCQCGGWRHAPPPSRCSQLRGTARLVLALHLHLLRRLTRLMLTLCAPHGLRQQLRQLRQWVPQDAAAVLRLPAVRYLVEYYY